MQGREVQYPPGKDDQATLRAGGNLAYAGCNAVAPECQLPVPNLGTSRSSIDVSYFLERCSFCI